MLGMDDARAEKNNLNTNLKATVCYINTKDTREPALIFAISRSVSYKNGIGEIDISGYASASGGKLRSVLNTETCSGTLPTVFTILCAKL